MRSLLATATTDPPGRIILDAVDLMHAAASMHMSIEPTVSQTRRQTWYFNQGGLYSQTLDKCLCAQICEYGTSAYAVDAKGEVKTDKSARRFPRVTICSDGSFCSDKDGIACCGQKKGEFRDKNANIVNGPVTTTLSWGPEHTPSGYQTIATTAGSASQTPSPTPKPDPNGNDAVTISAGVGISVGVIAIGAIAAVFFTRRGKRTRASTSAQELPNKGGQKRPRTPGCRPAPRN
ncbi:hypothetical protein MHUMG1_03519 [Metarhizium humberi]|uniref:Uncharacterized protein n=1 Tax=Metarhizium humberi TaxID=2596975 RepID=A0A9P8MGQ9_9HYPO|nr:hypothetical protein MHUMG1_03519 [Metarhizium humberi]